MGMYKHGITPSSVRAEANALSLEHVRRLERIRDIFVKHKKSILRRRSWRDSEKAMALADNQLNIDAMDCALSILAPIGEPACPPSR